MCLKLSGITWGAFLFFTGVTLLHSVSYIYMQIRKLNDSLFKNQFSRSYLRVRWNLIVDSKLFMCMIIKASMMCRWRSMMVDEVIQGALVEVSTREAKVPATVTGVEGIVCPY